MGYIDLDALKLQSKEVDPRQVLEHLQPNKPIFVRGGELRTCCPIHKGDGAENFAINTSTHEFTCHSNGCKGTNLIDLIAQSQGIKFIEAAEEFTSRFSIKVESKNQEISKKTHKPEDVLRCWDEAKPQGRDVYFKRKGLTPPSIVRYGKNPYKFDSILVPLRDIERDFKGFICLQEKYPKCYYKYRDIAGAFAQLGEINPDGEFYAGEGIATVQTAWESTQKEIPAICCGSWHNILPVVAAIKGKYPNSKPIILIDCDEGGNGLKAAQMVANAKEIPDASFRKPSFNGFHYSESEKPTDFNDIISKCNQSLEEVRRQLLIEFDMTTLKDIQKIETSQVAAPKPTIVPKTHGGCETAKEAIKKLGILDRIKTRKLEYDRTGVIKISGISTGFPMLDEIIDGLQEGHLIILAGRTGMGKTFVELNMLKNIAIDQQIPASLFSLEMSNSQVFFRLISFISGVPAKKIKRGTISEEELSLVESAIAKIEASPLFLTDEPSNSILSNLSTNINHSCRTEKARAIFIDHIGLVNCGNDYRDNRANEMGKITMTCKIAAKQHGIPIVCLAQLNREADSAADPKLSHLRESGNLEQDADLVLFVHRRDYFDQNDHKNQGKVITAKNREGEIGYVNFNYSPTWLIKEFSINVNANTNKPPQF